MKYLKKFELCDQINTETKKDVLFTDENVFPFYVNKDMEVKFGKQGHSHTDMWIFDEIIRGRIFYDDKVIGFWDLEKFKNLQKLFDIIQRDLKKLYDDVNIFDGEWRVDVDVHTDEDLEKIKNNGYFTYKGYSDTKSALIPIKDFISGDYRIVTNQDAKILHNLNAKDKSKALKDSGYKPRFKNWKEWQKPFESKVIKKYS